VPLPPLLCPVALLHGRKGLPFPQFGLDRFLGSSSVRCEHDDRAARPPSFFVARVSLPARPYQRAPRTDRAHVLTDDELMEIVALAERLEGGW
jgi:hypothetical protein